MKYSIVIPTYNNCEKYLKPCVDSIFKWTNMADVELIISANGCVDSSYWYLQSLRNQFDALGFSKNLKIIWCDVPLGYAGATNAGIKEATCDKIILLNNDTVLLEQEKSYWLNLFDKPFEAYPNCGISCIIKGPSEPAGRDFAVFFCVMVHRKVFDKIGLLNEEYGVGGGEDTEFCIEAERAGFEVHEVLNKQWDGIQFSGGFPIYHKGEGTMHDPNLVQGWDNIFLRNSLKLAKKYNFEWYRWRLSNYWERAVFLKDDVVYPREVTRYQWANANLVGKKILEIGCSNGYGTQFFPADIDYTGVDYDPIIVDVAVEQGWGTHAKFFNADINKFPLEQYDTIVAFEVIEHIDNGLEVVEMLKKHCKRLLITVPMNEPVGFWGPHHKLHGLNESHFPGFEFNYINEAGEIKETADPITETNKLNLLIARWTNG
jgi:glycosyltransferase involved in cell wall biosynthesis